MLLARDVNPAFHDTMTAECWRTGVASSLTAASEGSVGEVLLGVAAGRGIALLPASVADRHAMPGVRFTPLGSEAPACEVALVSDPGNASVPLAGFRRLLGEQSRRGRLLAAVA
jgi:DNA-binding transcriptional LysR family regulator